jgi:site-specific DNA recombinase
MARNTRIALMIADHCQRAGCELVLVNEPIDLSTAYGRFQFTVSAARAELDGELILEKTARGRLGKCERGEAWSNEKGTPYGYRYVKPKNKHTPARECYVIVPEEAEIVRRIFRLVAEGMSAQKVAELLTAEGIPTPDGKATWWPSTVRGIIHNTAYDGRLRRGVWQTRTPRDAEGNRLPRKTTKRSASELKELAIEPIVPRTVADRARENLAKGKIRAKRNLKHEYLLWSPRTEPLLICGKCLRVGRTQRLGGVAKHTTRNGTTYTSLVYQCVYLRADARRAIHQVGAERLEQAVWFQLCDMSADPTPVLAEIQTLADAASAAAHRLEEEVAEIAARLEDLDLQEDRLMDLYQVGTVSVQKLKPRLVKINLERERLKARELELRLQHQAAVEQTIPVRDIEMACRLVWQWVGSDPPCEVKRRVVTTLLTRVVAWLDDEDGKGQCRSNHKPLHLHMEGKLPTLQSRWIASANRS